MNVNIYEIVYDTPNGLNNEVVTADSQDDAIERFDGYCVKVINRGPYLGDGPFQAVREEILSRPVERPVA